MALFNMVILDNLSMISVPSIAVKGPFMILREMFEAEIKHGKGQRPWVTLQDENDKDRHRELIDAAGDDGKIRLLQRRRGAPRGRWQQSRRQLQTALV